MLRQVLTHRRTVRWTDEGNGSGVRDDRSRSRSPQPQGTRTQGATDRERRCQEFEARAARKGSCRERTRRGRRRAADRVHGAQTAPWGRAVFFIQGRDHPTEPMKPTERRGPARGAAQRRSGRDASTVRRRRCSRRRRRRPVRGRRVTRRPVRADKRHGGPPARATRGGANHDARLPHPATENVEHRGGGTAGTGNQADSNHGRCRAFSIRWTQQTEEEAAARAALVASILARRTSTNGRSE